MGALSSTFEERLGGAAAELAAADSVRWAQVLEWAH